MQRAGGEPEVAVGAGNGDGVLLQLAQVGHGRALHGGDTREDRLRLAVIGHDHGRLLVVDHAENPRDGLEIESALTGGRVHPLAHLLQDRPRGAVQGGGVHGFGAAAPVDVAEVALHSFEGERVQTIAEHPFGALDQRAQILRRLALGRLEHHRAATLLQPPLAVAAAGRLRNGIEPRHGAPHLREVDVHTGLDQRGSDQTHGAPGKQAGLHLRQHRSAMHGTHQGAEVADAIDGAPIGPESIEQVAGVAAAVDDAEHLRLLGETLHDLGIGGLLPRRASTDHIHAFQRRVKPLRIGGEFARVVDVEADLLAPLLRSALLVGEAVAGAQGRLGSGAEHHAGAIIGCKLIQRRHAGAQQPQRQGLRLVQHHHGVRDVVQLAARGGATGEQALEELHRRGDHDRRIPVLSCAAEFGETLLPLVVGVLDPARRVPVEACVMLQHAVIRPERLAEDRGGLLDDRGVGDDVDHPVQAVAAGVFQREGKRGQRLATARGHGESEGARLQSSLGDRVVQHL